MIELIVTACLQLQPERCDELRLPTGFKSIQSCEANGMILAAGMMVNLPGWDAVRYRCKRVGPLPFGDNKA